MKYSAVILFILLSFSFANAAKKLTLEAAMESAQSGNVLTLKKYKSQKSDLNGQDSEGLTLLMRAVGTGQHKVVSYLLQQKVNLELKNENGDTALVMAIGNEQDQIAVALIEAGAKTDVVSGEEKNNLIFLATSVNAEKTLTTLLKKVPDQINAKNPKGETALHEAARFGSEKTLTALLKAGAKKDIANNDGKTPLDVAKSIKNEAAIKLLEASTLVK